MFELLSFVVKLLLLAFGTLAGMLVLYCIVCFIVLGAKELKKELSDENKED